MAAPLSFNRSCDVLIVGAGVLGLSTALELTARGHAVRVVDPGGINASAVAAGMIAPALESAVEGATPQRAALLRAARDLWPGFADRHGLILHRRPTEWRGEAATMGATLAALGFAARRDAHGRLWVTDEDFQVDAMASLAAMAAILGPDMKHGRVVGLVARPGGWTAQVESTGGEEKVSTGAVVLATGAGAPIPGLPDGVSAQVAAIRPIRGQIGRAIAATPAAVLRGPGGYAAPTPGGVLIGATMDMDRRDLAPDTASAARLESEAVALLGSVPRAIDWRVGVRGATPDGLPLAGPSGEGGLFLALAPRRNGWLLAPLAAATVADAIEAKPPGPYAAALDPRRPQPGQG